MDLSKKWDRLYQRTKKFQGRAGFKQSWAQRAQQWADGPPPVAQLVPVGSSGGQHCQFLLLFCMFQDSGAESAFSNNCRVLKFIVIRLTMANSGEPAAMVAEGKVPVSVLGRHQQDHRNDLLKETPRKIG